MNRYNRVKLEKRGFWARQYAEAGDYILESRNYIYFAILFFILNVLIGFILSERFSFLDIYLKDIVRSVSGLSGGQLIVYIFFNNLVSAMIGLFFGVLICIPSLMNLIMNGIVVGYVLKLTYVQTGIGEFWRILPHGIFELPAIFIALGLGIRLGAFAFSQNRKKEFVRRMIKSLKAFVYVIVPLLIIAAIIEGTLVALYK